MKETSRPYKRIWFHELTATPAKDDSAAPRKVMGAALLRRGSRTALVLLALWVALFTCGCRQGLFPEGYFADEWSTIKDALSGKQGEVSATVESENDLIDFILEAGEPWFTLDGVSIPVFDGETAYIALNENIPTFSAEEKTKESFESYSPLDGLGRAQVAFACVGTELMPTVERGETLYGPTTGYINRKYAFISDGQYLYNHCHLIGYQLTGETDNAQNIITGTRFMNVEGMLPFENEVASYIRRTGNHVLYRVTPLFMGTNCWPGAWSWRPIPWRIMERAFAFMYSAIMYSPG